MAVSEAPRKSANKPGVRVTGFPPNTDEDYLDLYFQKFGDVERVHMAEEGSAYIEFVNSSESILKVLEVANHKVRRKPVAVEEVDLVHYLQPFLVVKAFPAFIDHTVLADHFRGAAKGIEVQKIEMKDGPEALVFFTDPNVTLQVAQEKQTVFGQELEVTVGYTSPQPQEDCVLAVTGLDAVRMAPTMLEQALRHYFKLPSNGGHDILSCGITDGTVYIDFPDTTTVHEIVSNPPQEEFLAGVHLTMSAVSKSRYSKSQPESLPIEVPVSARPPTAGSGLSSPPVHGGTSPTASGPINMWATPRPVPQHPPHSPVRYRHESAGLQSSVAVHPQMSLTPSHGVHYPASSPRLSLDSPMMVVEDVDDPISYEQHQMTGIVPNKAIVKGFPPNTEDYVLELYLGHLAQGSHCCDIQVYGHVAVATFQSPIDATRMHQQSKSYPFPSHKKPLEIKPFEAATSIMVSYSSAIPDYTLRMYFESVVDKEYVSDVQLVSSSRALVTFTNHQCVQKVLERPQHSLGPNKLSVREYYEFSEPPMASKEIDQSCHQDGVSNVITPEAEPSADDLQPKILQKWLPMKRKVSVHEYSFLQRTQGELNAKLEATNASASFELDGEDKFLTVSPLPTASASANWATEISGILHEHFTQCKESSFTYCHAAKGEVLQYLMGIKGVNNLQVNSEGDTVTIAGERTAVEESIEIITAISEDAEVLTTTVPLERKYIRYLLKFCQRDLRPLDTELQCEYNIESEGIVVKGNKKRMQTFKTLVDHKIQLSSERKLPLTTEAYKLLSSEKGQGKIGSLLGTLVSQVIYEVEICQATMEHQICFLAPTRESCERAVSVICLYTKQKHLPIAHKELAICQSPEWKVFVGQVAGDCFVSVEVSGNSVVITGEEIALDDVESKVTAFFEDKTSIDDVLECEISEWRIISVALRKEFDAIKKDAKKQHTKVTEPERSSHNASGKVSIRVKGEPSHVADVKQQIEMLKRMVITREARVAEIPSLASVLESAEHGIRMLEHKHNVVIEIDAEHGGDESSSTVKELPQKLCTASLSGGFRVSVFSGNFTLHPGGGTILNFLLPSGHNFQQGSLKTLVDAGGRHFQEELLSRISQCLSLTPPLCIRSGSGKLACNQLLHCVIPPWSGGAQSEAVLLEESLVQTFQGVSPYATLLITPGTCPPFSYPASVFVDTVISALTSGATSQMSDLDIVVFVNEPLELNEFEKCLRGKGFQVSLCPNRERHQAQVSNPLDIKRPKVVSSARSLSSNIGSFIVVTNGDMLKQQADVFVNSTNESLNLSQGQLSQVLLAACGKELQDECTKYSPLKVGDIAVTTARNLPCKHIIHVVLPDFKTSQADRVYRNAVQNFLRAAASEGASSIAIPSLGVANLNYPAPIAAKILFEEIIQFHARNPNSIKKFHFVIFKKEDYLVFNKEYVQRMSTLSAGPQLQSPAASSASKSESNNTCLMVIKGNLADEITDIIVNTTRSDMDLSTGAVSKALLRKAGPTLQSMCKTMVENGLSLDKGNVVLTKACGNLRCKKILHVHIPPHMVAVQSSLDIDSFIEKVVTDCLQKAEDDSSCSISFPVFGVGGGGYSIGKVGEPMLRAFKAFGASSPRCLKTIRVVIIDDKSYDSFYHLFCVYFNSYPTKESSRGFLPALKATLGFEQGIQNIVDLSPESRKVSSSAYQAASHFRGMQNAVVVFRIFSSSNAVAEQTESEIRKCLKQHIKEEIVDCKQIGSLLEDDFDELTARLSDLEVQLIPMKKMKQIKISGEKTNVANAKVLIISMMHDIEHATDQLETFQWSTYSDEVLEPYPDEAAAQLERARVKGTELVELVIDGIEVVIDLKSMEETSKITGKRVIVKREKKELDIEYPPTWTQPMDGDKTCHLYEVPEGTDEFTDATKEFCEKMGPLKFTIAKVQRVQNPNIYACYDALRRALRRKYGKAVVERRLFHGTKPASIEAITHQGFNRNFAADANAAHFGKGVYFAVNAWYSAQEKYSVLDKATGYRYMFICRMLVGEYTRGTRDMKVAPSLPQQPNVPYDALVDNVENPTIFVAMTDAQAYAEYLVSFTLDKK